MDVPESSDCGTVFAQSRAAATLPQARAGAGVNVGKKIFVRRTFVMVETQVHAFTIGDHIAGGAMIHRNVMDEPGAKIEAGEQVVLAFKIKTMVAGAMQSWVRLASGCKNNVFNRAETSVGKNTAVGVRDENIAHPAVGDTGKRDGVVARFGEMPCVRDRKSTRLNSS